MKDHRLALGKTADFGEYDSMIVRSPVNTLFGLARYGLASTKLTRCSLSGWVRKWGLLMLIGLVLPACSAERSSSATTGVTPDTQVTPLSAPGIELLSRMIDDSTIDVRITLTRNGGQTEQIIATRTGSGNLWTTQSISVAENEPFSIQIVWSAIGSNGQRIDYTRHDQTYESGVNSSQQLDLTTIDYDVDMLDDDGDGASNFDELSSGTDATDSSDIPDRMDDPVPTTPPQAVQASLDFVQDKTIRISWQLSDEADSYSVFENADGASGFVNISGRLSASSNRFDHRVALFLRVNAQYSVEACNDIGCSTSGIVAVSDTLSGAVGYFKARTTDAGDAFGTSVSLSRDGTTLAVGAPGDSSSSTGINNDQSDDSADESGAVYVYSYDGDAWQQQAYIKAGNNDAFDSFGSLVSLSVDGNTLAVSAPGEDSSSRSINANAADNSADNAGAVYVFTRTGNSWQQQAYLKADNAEEGDRFGQGMSLSGNGTWLAAGAVGESSAATGIDGDRSDNSLADAGAVYVFTRRSGNWRQQAFIKPDNTGAGDRFGISVDLSSGGGTLGVGASGEQSAAQGINANGSDNSFAGAGAAYIFVSDDGQWEQQAYLKPGNTGASDNFGASVSLSSIGNTFAVAATGERSSATGINGNTSDDSSRGAGAVYVFERSEGNWRQEAYIKASNTNENDLFGTSVSISLRGNTLVVGARGEASAAMDLNGNQSNNSASGSGAAYVYVRTDRNWRQRAYLKASNTDANNDAFGVSVSVNREGDTVAVGAPNEGSSAAGINGDQSNNSAPGAGAVYLY